MSRRSCGRLVWMLALMMVLGGGSVSAASGALGGGVASGAVVSGTFAGKADGAAVGVAVVAGKPAAQGQPRTISVYVCNGTSLSVWLTGQTAGNEIDLRSADARFGVHVALTAQTASGKFGISGGSGFRFSVPRALGVAGLFDVSVIASGTLSGRSPTGGTLTGRVGAAGKLRATGTVVATVSAGGKTVKLSALGRHLTPGAYRWIILTNRTVYGANRRGPGFGGIGGLRPRGNRLVRIKDAGSAGQPGWDDSKCRALANNYNKALDGMINAQDKGLSTARDWERLATDTRTQLENHCLVVEGTPRPA